MWFRYKLQGYLTIIEAFRYLAMASISFDRIDRKSKNDGQLIELIMLTKAYWFAFNKTFINTHFFDQELLRKLI